MSYILDAITKSEKERQQQLMPGGGQGAWVAPAYSLVQKKSWVLPAAVGVSLNVLVAIIWWQPWSSHDDGDVEPRSFPLQVSKIDEKNYADEFANPLNTSVVVAESGLFPETKAKESMPEMLLPSEYSRNGDEISQLVVETENSEVMPALTIDGFSDHQAVADKMVAESEPQLEMAVETFMDPTPVPELEVQPLDPSPRIPYLYELPEEIQDKVPQVLVSVHIYSENPSSRMVKINNTRMGEGQMIADDVMIEEITRDGMVLDYRGTRFKVNPYQTGYLGN